MDAWLCLDLLGEVKCAPIHPSHEGRGIGKGREGEGNRGEGKQRVQSKGEGKGERRGEDSVLPLFISV